MGGVLRFLLTWIFTWWIPVVWLLSGVVPGGWLTMAGAVASTTAPLLLIVRAFTHRTYPGAAQRLLVFRPFWYVQLSLPWIASAATVGALAGWPFGVPAQIGRWAMAAAGAALAGMWGVGYLLSRRLVVRQQEARFAALPEAFDGVRVVQISDLHVGPHTSKRHLRRVAQAVMDAKPDLIAITGDQVDDFGPDVHVFTRAFAGLDAPLGVFAIPGNHDVFAGWSEVRAGLEHAGFTVLVNEARPIERGAERMWVVGTGDPAGRRFGPGPESPAPDLDRACADVPSGSFALGLAHDPSLWPGLVERGIHLTLSGHTHHGQFSIPHLGWSVASPFLRFAMGRHRSGDAELYINPGTNYWGVPFRIGSMHEVTVMTLRRA